MMLKLILAYTIYIYTDIGTNIEVHTYIYIYTLILAQILRCLSNSVQKLALRFELRVPDNQKLQSRDHENPQNLNLKPNPAFLGAWDLQEFLPWSCASASVLAKLCRVPPKP